MSQKTSHETKYQTSENVNGYLWNFFELNYKINSDLSRVCDIKLPYTSLH